MLAVRYDIYIYVIRRLKVNVSTLRGPHLETPNSGIPYHITAADELTLSMLRTEKQHVFWTELFHCVSQNTLFCNNNFRVLRNFRANIS